MSDTPVRIWLDYAHSNLHWMAFDEPPNDRDGSAGDEYVRADLADAWAKERDRLRSDLAAAQRERDAFRAILEGAEYPKIDNLPALGADACLAIGKEVATLSKALRAKRDAAQERAEKMREALDDIADGLGEDKMTGDVANMMRAVARAAIAAMSEK